MTSLTNFAENKIVDAFYRAQALGVPATWHFALFTAAPGEAGGGTETVYTNYLRVAVTCSLANFAGTQGAGTTVASTGTGGQTSNNNPVTFAAPGATGATVTHFGLMDASSGGNMWQYGALTASRTLTNGDAAPSFAAAAWTSTWD